jgi:hypothetical protein
MVWRVRQQAGSYGCVVGRKCGSKPVSVVLLWALNARSAWSGVSTGAVGTIMAVKTTPKPVGAGLLANAAGQTLQG